MRWQSCASSLFVGFIGCTPITGGLGNSEGGAPVDSSSTTSSDGTDGTATSTTATADTTAPTTAPSDTGVTSDDPPGGSTSPLDGSTSDGSTSAATEGSSTGGPPPQSLPELQCTEEGSVASIESVTSADVTFHNTSGAIRQVFWLDYSGLRYAYGPMQPDEAWGFGTYVTHPWLIADETGQCLTIFVTEAGVHDIDLY